VTAADFLCRSHNSGPNRGRGSLRDWLPLERGPSPFRGLPIDLVDQCLQGARVHMTSEFGLDPARMHCRGAYFAVPMPPIEGDREEDVCRLRAAVGDEGLVGCPLKIRILEVYVREAVTRRGEVDQPASVADQRRDPI